jgi:hypothetical protein
MRHLVLLGILIWTLIVIGSPPTVGADIIMTLDATSGALKQFQDSAFGSAVSGPGFVLDGFLPQIGSALPFFSLLNLEAVPGQLIDQSGPLRLYAPSVGINGHLCCGMIGTLNISAIPSVPVPGSVGPPTLVVTSPFAASGILRTTLSTTNLFDQGPYGEYFFEGAGTMTSVFRASCGTVNEPSCYFWNESVLTFAPTVPEPATWLLLASGLVVVLFLSRRRLMSQLDHPQTYPENIP